MTRSKWIPLEDAAALIPNQATVSVSLSSGLGCPDATLRASGVLFHMYGDAAAGRPGVPTKVGLDTFVDLRPMVARRFRPEPMGLRLPLTGNTRQRKSLALASAAKGNGHGPV